MLKLALIIHQSLDLTPRNLLKFVILFLNLIYFVILDCIFRRYPYQDIELPGFFDANGQYPKDAIF